MTFFKLRYLNFENFSKMLNQYGSCSFDILEVALQVLSFSAI